MDVLDDVKEIILDLSLRINGFDSGGISQPKIDIKELDL
jgi:hypothetical protein